MFDLDEIAEAECLLPSFEEPLGFLQDVGFGHAPTSSGCAKVVPQVTSEIRRATGLLHRVHKRVLLLQLYDDGKPIEDFRPGFSETLHAPTESPDEGNQWATRG